MVGNKRSPFDSIIEFAHVGWAEELATLFGILQGGKKCNDVLWVKSCIDKVIFFGREVVKAGVCLILDGDDMDGFVSNVRVVVLEPFDDSSEMGPIVLVDGI